MNDGNNGAIDELDYMADKKMVGSTSGNSRPSEQTSANRDQLFSPSQG
jgi:hypothetical protein